MLKKLTGLLPLLIVLVAVAPAAWGGSTLHIGFGAGTACAIGCGGHPNVSGIASGSAFFDIYQNSGGAPVLNPILLILGIPNQTHPAFFSHDSISALTSINPYPGGTETGSPPNSWTYGTTVFGLGADVGFGAASGYRGEFTALTGGDVYGFLRLTGANNSNNWVNWHDSDLATTGTDASGFGIYVFALHATLGPKGLLNIEFPDANAVPTGSYLLAYGSGTIKKNRISTDSTPFTEAGLYIDPPLEPQARASIPEPGTLLLLGTGLAGLGSLAWGRLRRVPSGPPPTV